MIGSSNRTARAGSLLASHADAAAPAPLDVVTAQAPNEPMTFANTTNDLHDREFPGEFARAVTNLIDRGNPQELAAARRTAIESGAF